MRESIDVGDGAAFPAADGAALVLHTPSAPVPVIVAGRHAGDIDHDDLAEVLQQGLFEVRRDVTGQLVLVPVRRP